MKHILIFFSTGLVILGVAVIQLMRQRTQHMKRFNFKPLIRHTLAYNLFLLSILLGEYINTNLPHHFFFNRLDWPKEVGYGFQCLLFWMMFYNIFQIAHSLLKRPIKRPSLRLIHMTAMVLLLAEGLYIVNENHNPFLEFIHNGIVDNIVLFEFGILIWMLWQSRRWPLSKEKRMIQSFGWLYMSRLLFLAVIIPVPISFRLFFIFLALVGANCVPWIWIQYFALPTLAAASGPSLSVQAFAQQHRLSQREEEILKLILNGKSNGEIKDDLSVSYHTVKNHITHLYKKTSVTTRYELITLVQNHETLKTSSR